MEENNANVLNNENLNENMNANLNENENMSTETGADTGMDEGAVSGTEDSGMADADMVDDGMAVGDESGQEDAMEAARQELLERFDKIKGFKVIDDNGNEEGISVDDMVTLVALKMSSAMAGGGLNSGISTLEEGGVSALADSASTGNDAYENQLPARTDCSHVRIIGTDGASGIMTKQALATLLGELLQMFNYFKDCGFITDLDDIDYGFWRCNTYTVNTPTNNKAGSFVVCFKWDNNAKYEYFVEYNTGHVYRRMSKYGNWGDWVKILTI